MSQYLVNVVTQFSVMFNVLTGGRPYQTFSARSWEDKRRGRPNAVFLIDYFFGVVLSKVLTNLGLCDKNYFDNHCMESWVYWSCRKAVMKQLEDEIETENAGSGGNIDIFERELSLVREGEEFVYRFEVEPHSRRFDTERSGTRKIKKIGAYCKDCTSNLLGRKAYWRVH